MGRQRSGAVPIRSREKGCHAMRVIADRPHLLALVLIAVLTAAPCHAAWLRLASQRDASGEPDAYFSAGDFLDDGQTGWVSAHQHVGAGPRLVLICHTADGGESWQPLDSGINANDVRALDFVNANVGWLVTDEPGIYRTDDGGETWTPEEVEGADVWQVNDLLMMSPTAGLACGSIFGRHRATVFDYDAGPGRWQHTISRDDGELNALGGARMDSAVTAGTLDAGGYVGYRRDGSADWSNVQPLSSVQAISCRGRPRAWAACDLGRIFHTSDGGETWQEQETPIYDRFVGIHFTSRDEGIAVSESGLTVRTVDGGDTWRYMARATGPVNDLCWDGERYVLVCDEGLHHWQEVVILGPFTATVVESREPDLHQCITLLEHIDGAEITAGYFRPDGRLGFVGVMRGGEPALYRTDDGAETWNEVELPEYFNNAILDFDFADDLRGWACGEPSNPISTRDGGLTWVGEQFNRPSLADDRIHCIAHIEGEAVYATASRERNQWLLYRNPLMGTWDYGGVMFTEPHAPTVFSLDAGHQWLGSTTGNAMRRRGEGTELVDMPMFVGATKLIRQFHFVTPDEGWAILAFHIYHTDDGGESWEEQHRCAEDDPPMALAFEDTEKGAAVTRRGGFLITHDGGETWRELHRTGLQFVDLHRCSNQWIAIATDGIHATMARRGVFGPWPVVGRVTCPELRWPGGSYIGDGIRGDSGSAYVAADFRVVYADEDGDAPEYVRLVITDPGCVTQVLSMRRVPWDWERPGYRDGVTYGLGYTPVTDGVFHYHFEASDRYEGVATGPPTEPLTWTVEP